MYEIVLSNRFRKDLKLAAKRGYNISLLEQVVDTLAIQIFNYGNCKRDFTYVDDIVEGVKRVMQGAPEKKTGEDGLPIPPYAVYNIGNRQQQSGKPSGLCGYPAAGTDPCRSASGRL